MDRDKITNIILLRNTVFPRRSEPNLQVSMSPSAGDVAQTPEPKSTSGFASVFKSLTGSRSTKNPIPHSPPSVAQQLNGSNALQSVIYGGPPDYEQLYEQLKSGNTLADRLAAAETLRHAVQDYPLSGVSLVQLGRERLTDNWCRLRAYLSKERTSSNQA